MLLLFRKVLNKSDIMDIINNIYIYNFHNVTLFRTDAFVM